MIDSVPRQSVSDRLNELSNLASQGRSNAVNAGPIMLIWGAAIATAALLEECLRGTHYSTLAWLIPVLLAYVASLFAVRLSRADERAVTWRSRAIYRVWIAAGTAIVIFNVGEELRRTGIQSESEAATALILSVAVLATAELASRKLLLWAGAGWLLAAAGLFINPGDNALNLLTYAATFLQIAPGIALILKK